jgi:hypothetical protein
LFKAFLFSHSYNLNPLFLTVEVVIMNFLVGEI